jgi:hypothetical protein
VTSRSEHEFCAQVVALARGLGLLAHWCRDSRKCAGDPGFPDLTIAGPGGVLFGECKMPGGETSPAQDHWIWTLWKTGATVMMFRPVALENGVIERTLEQLL